MPAELGLHVGRVMVVMVVMAVGDYFRDSGVRERLGMIGGLVEGQ